MEILSHTGGLIRATAVIENMNYDRDWRPAANISSKVASAPRGKIKGRPRTDAQYIAEEREKLCACGAKRRIDPRVRSSDTNAGNGQFFLDFGDI